MGEAVSWRIRAETLRLAASKAWEKALSDFYHPPLPEPKVDHEPDAACFFFIDSSNWVVHLNTAGVPLPIMAHDAEQFLRSVCHHEIQHYLVCPYDGVINGMMFAAARKHVNDATAMFACNLFADLVVDSSLLKRFPELTWSRVNASLEESNQRTNHHSSLWMLIVYVYNAMWGFNIPGDSRIESDTMSTAKDVVSIARKFLSDEKKWSKAAEEIAKLLDNWDPDSGSCLAGCGGANDTTDSEKGNISEGVVLIPADVDVIMGSPVEVRNGDLARKCLDREEGIDLEAEMERLANDVVERGGNLKDLESVYLAAGIGSKNKEWIRFWYRAKAQGLLRFEVSRMPSSASLPLTAEPWRLGDPIEDLDIVQSLQAFPILVPNMSTRKWMKTSIPGNVMTEDLPDLLIVIDSSGSMTWSMRANRVSGPYHTALIAAFYAIDSALRKGRRIAVINFSDGVSKCSWTRNRTDAEKILLAYQGGGTVAPVKHVASLCDEAGKSVMVLMITDAEIANWDNLLDSVDSTTKKGHKYFLFHIRSSKSSEHRKLAQDLSRIGVTVIPIKSVQDLPGLVIKEMRGVYSS